MPKDLNFEKILDVLREIHELHPGIRFGQVLQVALDRKVQCGNSDLNDRSSKEIYKALQDYKDFVNNQKKEGKGVLNAR